MPIRFRCAYCSQLMAIGRRKAGMVVRCPKCAGEIIVPPPEEMQESSEAGTGFDAENFDVQLESMTLPTPNESPQAVAEAPPPAPTPAPPRRLGVFVPIGMMIIFVGAVILLMIFVFVLGLIIGRQLTPA